MTSVGNSVASRGVGVRTKPRPLCRDVRSARPCGPPPKSNRSWRWQNRDRRCGHEDKKKNKKKTHKTKVEAKPKTKAEVKTKVEVKIKNMPKPKAKPAATRLKKVSALPPVDEAVTAKEYTQLEAAFDHLNRELFGGRLPHVLITYQRRANSKGYFSDGRIAGRISKFTKAEIALNID